MTMNNYYKHMGPYIKKLREDKGLTKSQLAKGICSISYISRIEQGERYPSSLILRQLATKLGTSTGQLFRHLESERSINTHNLITEVYTYIRRHSFAEIQKLINAQEQEIDQTSLEDMQSIRLFKCICRSILQKDYDWGLEEVKAALALTYSGEGDVTDIEFSLMFFEGYLYLLRKENDKAYEVLIEMEKFLYEVKNFRDFVIVARYYVLVSVASINTMNLTDASRFISEGIDYCKTHNVACLLRELYYLKAELHYYRGDKEGFELWKNNALLLHELIGYDHDEEFEQWIHTRMESLENKGETCEQ